MRERLILALHVLRGRPLMYRMHLRTSGIEFINADKCIVAECVFVGFGTDSVVLEGDLGGPNGVILEDRL